MKLIKRSVTIILICVCIAALFGCADGEVLATVNGENITEAEFEAALNDALSYYGTTNEELEDFLYQSYGDLDYAQQEANALRDTMLDDMITTELMMQKAKENGLDVLTEEEQQEIKDMAASDLEYYKDYYTSLAESAAAEDPSINVEEYAEEQYLQAMQEYGITQSSLEEKYTEQIILQKIYDHYMSALSVTEEDYTAYYNELMAEQKELAESDPEIALYSYLNYMNDVNVYIPENAVDEVRNVKHILIAIDDATMEEISALETEGDTDGAAELREQALEEIKADAEAALERVNSGEDFDALMEELSYDYQESSDNLYVVYEGAGFVDSFTEASLALKNVGDVSPLTASEYGWHIIKYIEEPETGEVPYEEVAESIIVIVDNEKETEYWYALLDELLAEAEVTRVSFLEPVETTDEAAEETEAATSEE